MKTHRPAYANCRPVASTDHSFPLGGMSHYKVTASFLVMPLPWPSLTSAGGSHPRYGVDEGSRGFRVADRLLVHVLVERLVMKDFDLLHHSMRDFSTETSHGLEQTEKQAY